MKPSLQLGLSQQLALTPQLQQAIRLLQLSTLDLQQEIQQALDSNPLLETVAPEEKEAPAPNANSQQTEENQDASGADWHFSDFTANKRTGFDDPDFNYDNVYCTTTNLTDHLRWQLDLSPMSDTDRLIAETLIDSTNADGFLTTSLHELHMHLTTEARPVEIDEIEAVRHRIQQFDPVGCACFTLSETLLVQLNQFAENSESLRLAKALVKDDLELLAQHHYRQLLKRHQVKENLLQEALHLIQRLNPKPGSIIQQEVTEYIIPDVLVKKKNGQWCVRLNQNTLPRLGINAQYAGMIQRADNSTDNLYLKNNLQEARWFLKSIQSRQETLLRVAECIVEYQHDFFEHGPEAMKPLILNDVAQALDLHESTISRVTTQKFMHTPRGVFELKYFFSSHVATDTGGECSSTAIRAFIKKLITGENRQKPFSDSKIAVLMGEQGIRVARRTIAKYREAMGIAPSNERKTLRQ